MIRRILGIALLIVAVFGAGYRLGARDMEELSAANARLLKADAELKATSDELMKADADLKLAHQRLMAYCR